MKDALMLLLLAGLVCAGFAALFFKYLGSDAFSVLGCDGGSYRVCYHAIQIIQLLQ